MHLSVMVPLGLVWGVRSVQQRSLVVSSLASSLPADYARTANYTRSAIDLRLDRSADLVSNSGNLRPAIERTSKEPFKANPHGTLHLECRHL